MFCSKTKKLLAKKYSKLKPELAQKHPYSREKYMDGKDVFIQQIEQKAIE